MNTKKYKVCGDLKAFMTDVELDGDLYEVKLSYMQKPALTPTPAEEVAAVADDSAQCCEDKSKLVSTAA